MTAKKRLKMRINKTFKFPTRFKTTFCLLTATGLTFQAADASDLLSSSSDSPLVSSHFSQKVRAGLDGVIRSFRAISTFGFTVADYKFSLLGIPEDSHEYRRKLSEVHLRSAKRTLKLCEANKGFYVKAGQFVAALRQVPREYSSTLSSLQDQAAPCHFKAIKEVLISNLGQNLSDIFLLLDEEPIAAASIAQVHHAVLKDHQEVAIKVQYPDLEQKMKLDTTIMVFLSKWVAWFFPEYRFGWLVSEFVEAISLELDFIQEAKSSETMAKNFSKNKMVRVPSVFWDLTSSHVLTMQFCSGHKVDDVEFMKKMRISPAKVAKVLTEVFAEMIFLHGFLHGDPHPGNILVSPEGQNGFTLVLLDYGICKKLDERFRVDYCELWKALILLDADKIENLCERFGVGKYSRFFPVIFMGRTIDSKSALGKGMSTEEKNKLKQELKSLKMEDISSFMESLPPDFLTILRTDGLLRSIISKLGASQQVRLLAYAKHALYGLAPKSDHKSVKVVLSRLNITVTYLQLRLVLGVLELLHWMGKFKQSLYALCKRTNSGIRCLVTLY